MSEEKTKMLDITKLEKDQVVWSAHFKTYLQFVGRDEEHEFLFKEAAGDRYFVLYKTDIYEPSSLMKELF